jgi:hypothetical protein
MSNQKPITYDERILTGKTIERFELLPNLRFDFRNYLCISFTTGERFLCGFTSIKHFSDKTPHIDYMKRAENFFTKQEIEDRIKVIEVQEIRHQRHREEQEKRELKRLQQKYSSCVE